MFCPNCGKQLNDGAAFCTGCGKQLQERNVHIQKKSNKKYVIALVGVLLACLMIGLVTTMTGRLIRERQEAEAAAADAQLVAETVYGRSDEELQLIPLTSVAVEQEIKKIGFKTVGDTVTFGQYEQDGDVTNGPEPVEWIILSSKSKYKIMVSKYILDRQSYSSSQWATSHLREWLNSVFYDTCFQQEEQDYIVTMKINNADNPHYTEENPTEVCNDKVWILSYDEYSKYDIGGIARPTEYAKLRGCYYLTEENQDYWAIDSWVEDGKAYAYSGNGIWWLRGTDIESLLNDDGDEWYTNYTAMPFDDSGRHFMAAGWGSENFGVRPVIAVKWQMEEENE